MPYKIVPADFITNLNRIRAELARRNGNGDLSSYSDIDFSEGTPIVGDLITTDHFNTLLTGLAYINSEGLPSEAVAGVTYINSNDIAVINSLLEAYESQPRSAISNNDCAALCSGMCVSECTTTCSTTCSSDCAESCSDNCTGTCNDTCSGTCTGTCSTTCTGGCTGSCSTTCTGGCAGSCTALCGYCTGTCQNACALACSTSCTGSCESDCAIWGG